MRKKLPHFDIYHLDYKRECHITKNVATSQLASLISLITHSVGEIIRIKPTITK